MDTIWYIDCEPDIQKISTVMVKNNEDPIGFDKATDLCISKEHDPALYLWLPPGDEYKITDYALRPRCDCDGTKIHYHRYTYRGDPTTCCLTGNSDNTYTTCDPKYRDMNLSTCAPLMRNYCLVNNRIFTDSKCSQWCTLNPTECINKKVELCNNLTSFKSNTQCKDFCMQNPGKCDTSMNLYCKEAQNIGNAECGCINSLVENFKYNPLCVDKECILGGYSTNSMLISRGEGCKILDCSVVFDMEKTGQITFQDTDIVQQCGEKQIANELSKVSDLTEISDEPINPNSEWEFINTNNTLGTNTANSDQTNNPVNTPQKKSWLVWLTIGLVGVVVLGGIGIGVWYYFNKGKENIATQPTSVQPTSVQPTSVQPIHL